MTEPKVPAFGNIEKTPMLTRICLIVAIVAGLAVAGLNFVKIKETITTLKESLASEISQKEAAQTELASTKKNLDQTTKERDAAKAEIASTQEERDKAVAEAENQTKRASRIADELAKTKQDLGDSQGEMAAWKALGISVDKVGTMITELKRVKEERNTIAEANRISEQKVASLKNRLMQYEDENYRVELPSSLQGKVLVADPKWDFVVLNIGQNQGLLENGVLLVNRNGRLVAKVQVRSVQPDRAIANVLPNWKLGEVMEGDQVIP